MELKQRARFFLTSFVILGILGVLSAIAIPNVERIIAKSEADERVMELLEIKSAVHDMLLQSVCGSLEPIGPTKNMRKVHTTDTCPLVLTDYLDDIKLDSGCSYCFAADGAVMQTPP